MEKNTKNADPTHYIIIIMLVITSISMQLINLISIADSVKFYLTVFVFVFVPGYTVLDLIKYKDKIASTYILSVLTGMAITPILYNFFRYLNQLTLFIVFSIICLFHFIIVTSKRLSKTDSKFTIRLKVDKYWWQVLSSLCLLLILLNYSHFGDLIVITGDGYLLKADESSETIFHHGIINALNFNFHPSFPYLSGYDLSYHLDMHLLSELLGRFSGIETLLISYYFIPLFYSVLLICVAALFFYNQSKNIAYSLMFAFTIYAGDISFILNYFNSTLYTEAGIALKAPSWSLLTLNGMLPGLALLFGAIIMFDHFLKDNKLKFILLLCLYIIASFRVKSSVAPHLIASITTTVIILYYLNKEKQYLKIIPAMLLTIIIIIIEHFSRGAASESIREIYYAPLNGLFATFDNLNINIPTYYETDQPVIWLTGILFSSILYIIGSYGIKIYFIKDALIVIKGKVESPIKLFLIIIIISGLVISELIFIGSEGGDINNGQWFSNQSLYVSGFFIILAIFSLKNTLQKKYLITPLAILLFYTGTLSFIKLRSSNHFIHITQQQLELSAYMKININNESIILEQLDYKPSTASHLTGYTNYISIFMTFLSSQASKSTIERRGIDTANFYLRDDNKKRLNFIESNNIDYVIVNKAIKNDIKDIGFGQIILQNTQYILIKTNSEY